MILPKADVGNSGPARPEVLAIVSWVAFAMRVHVRYYLAAGSLVIQAESVARPAVLAIVSWVAFAMRVHVRYYLAAGSLVIQAESVARLFS